MKRDYLTLAKRSNQLKTCSDLFEKIQTEIQEFEDDPQHENIRNYFDDDYWFAYKTVAIILNNTKVDSVFPNKRALKGDNNTCINNNQKSSKTRFSSINLLSFSRDYDS